jgi:predicted acyltransferase
MIQVAGPEVVGGVRSAPPTAIVASRMRSVDAYRGFVLLLMLAEVLHSCTVAAAVPGPGFWTGLCSAQTHAAWTGMSLHDFIQPSFYFLVGVALWLSISRRRRSGQLETAFRVQTITRSLVLIVLGIALLSLHPRRWEWSLIDTLTQIGLAYPFLVLISRWPQRYWYAALALILVGDWLWFASAALPSGSMDHAIVGVTPDWLQTHGLSGFAAHWQKNDNVAAAFDQWFLNLFPREVQHAGYENGLTTLNFVPSIGTMILGLGAGDVLSSGRSHLQKVRALLVTGAGLVFVGWAVGAAGLVPVVKAIWTPSWVLFSGGWCFLALASFYVIGDWMGCKRLSFPLVVLGTNSLIAYTLSHVYPATAFNSVRRVFGDTPFRILGDSYEPAVYGAVILVMYWLILYVLYRKRLFVRI